MKTKLLIISSLIIGGMLLSSCQKDNALIEDSSFEQMAAKTEAVDSPKTNTWSDEHDWGDIEADKITNYPDPFKMFTTIQYHLEKTSKVSLAVYNNQSELVIVLVNAYEGPGKHMVKFDSRGLRAGKYNAELKIGKTVYLEEMTKKPLFSEKKDEIISEQ